MFLLQYQVSSQLLTPGRSILEAQVARAVLVVAALGPRLVGPLGPGARADRRGQLLADDAPLEVTGLVGPEVEVGGLHRDAVLVTGSVRLVIAWKKNSLG